MKNSFAFIPILFLQFAHPSCTTRVAAVNPPNYDLSKPAVYKTPSVLEEISGIALSHANADTVFAEQDEEGKLFYFHLGDDKVQFTKFSKRGDYEDVAICSGMVIMLRSDGVFFTFPLKEMGNSETSQVTEQAGLLPKGEYESLFADESGNLLYLLCKTCSDDKSGNTVSGFVFNISGEGKLSFKNQFSIDEEPIADMAGKDKLRLKPSGIARHPLSHQWYILSSVNKLMVIADEQWKPLHIYPLPVALFSQPEGIAFDNAANLYIANEKGNAEDGTIFKFVYQQK